jgi:transcriptional regulator with XRE-family HTH domain
MVRRRITKHEEIRRARGLSVTRLADITGFSGAYVSQIESGKRASPRYRRAACSALGVPQEVLFPDA